MRKALLVGINTYPGSPLNGCVNDVKLMYKVFKDIYRYTDFKILTDAQGTKKNIIQGLKWLVQGSKAGDELVFHYSGHGSQVPVSDRTSSAEMDGLDEIICNIDLDWDDPIRDDDLGMMFKILNPKVKIAIILDCCHSGTGLRNPMPDKVKNRYLPPPPSMMLDSGEIDLDDDLNYMLAQRSKNPRQQLKAFMIGTVEQGNAILISGCQDNQTSADAYIGGRYQGALSFYLAQCLKEANWNISYSKLIEAVNTKLDQEQYEQNPQLEGKAQYFDTLFLGGKK